MLVEGSSMRSISRVVGVSINTVSKMLVEAGEACLACRDTNVHGLICERGPHLAFASNHFLFIARLPPGRLEQDERCH